MSDDLIETIESDVCTLTINRSETYIAIRSTRRIYR